MKTEKKIAKLFAALLWLCTACSVLAQTTFIDFKSTGWKHLEAYQDPTNVGNGTWKTNAYNDASWTSGQAPLGYEDLVSPRLL